MARRLLNVVTEKSGVYSLRRIDPNEHLFYPSTSEALAATAALRATRQKARPSKGSPPWWMEAMSLMPAPEEPAFRLSTFADSGRLTFLPLYGRYGSGGGDKCKILCTDETGSSILYDADAGSFKVVPSFNKPKHSWPILSYSVAHSHCEALYVMDSHSRGSHHFDSCNFEVLLHRDTDSGGSDTDGGDSDGGDTKTDNSDTNTHREASDTDGENDDGDTDTDGGDSDFGYTETDGGETDDYGSLTDSWHWRRLKQPSNRTVIDGHALVNTGSDTAICVSFNDGTWTTRWFNTRSHRWTKARDWRMPFSGRAVHVPELGGLWFGLTHAFRDQLVTMDLSSSFHKAPKVIYEWRAHLALPPDWWMKRTNLVYLGNGRFCIAKANDRAAVMFGVEVVRGPKSSKLRMVRHRSRFYKFTDDDRVDCIL